MKNHKVMLIGIRNGKIDTDAKFLITDHTDKFRRFEIRKSPPVKIEVRSLSPRKKLHEEYGTRLTKVEIQEFTERFCGGTKVVKYKGHYLDLDDKVILIEAA